MEDYPDDEPPPENTPSTPMAFKDEPPRWKENPCFCSKLRTGLYFTTGIGIVFYILLTITGVVIMALFSKSGYTGEGAGALAFLTGLLGLSFAIYLLFGVLKDSPEKIRIAFLGYIATLVMLMLTSLIGVFADTPAIKSEKKASWGQIFGGIVPIIVILGVSLYVLFVIWVYMKQLKRTGERVGEGPGGRYPVNLAYPKMESDLESSPGNPPPVRKGITRPVPVKVTYVKVSDILNSSQKKDPPPEPETT